MRLRIEDARSLLLAATCRFYDAAYARIDQGMLPDIRDTLVKIKASAEGASTVDRQNIEWIARSCPPLSTDEIRAAMPTAYPRTLRSPPPHPLENEYLKTEFGPLPDAVLNGSLSFKRAYLAIKGDGWSIVRGPEGSTAIETRPAEKVIEFAAQRDPRMAALANAEESNHAFNYDAPTEQRHLNTAVRNPDPHDRIRKLPILNVIDEGSIAARLHTIHNEILAAGGPGLRIPNDPIVARYQDVLDRFDRGELSESDFVVELAHRRQFEPVGQGLTYHEANCSSSRDLLRRYGWL